MKTVKIEKVALVNKLTNGWVAYERAYEELSTYDEIISRTDREAQVLDDLATDCLGKGIVGRYSNSPSGYSSRELGQFDDFIMDILGVRFNVSWREGYRTNDPWVYRDNEILITRE